MNYEVNLVFSKKDFIYNIENYGKKYNLLFITGMVGAGKTTTSKKIAKDKKAIILSQDWLGWSEVYKDDELAQEILEKFYKKCPKAKEAALENLWHRNMLSVRQRKEIREEYNRFLIEYSLKNKEKLFIIEGIDIYKAIPIDEILARGIIIKRTSGMKCFIRRYKRDKTKENQKNIKEKLKYMRMVVQESKTYYFRDRKMLNNLIEKALKK